MWIEDCPLADIAKAVGTPCYVYSAATLARHYHVFKQGLTGMDALVAYSVKANSNLAVLALLGKLGAGADVVSGGELARALRAGIPAKKIVFSGVGKTRSEMQAALATDILQFNVESVPELHALSTCAKNMDKIARIAFRINPDVKAGGHYKISTGKAENKFGIDIDIIPELFRTSRDLPGIELVGIDIHIGSQITDLAPFERAISKGTDLIRALRSEGYDILTFDVGGGLGIPYMPDETAPPSPVEYGKMARRLTNGLDLKMIFEPGRMITGNAGILLSEVIYVKSGGARNFIILDAAMNDLIRPALYGAYHDIKPVREAVGCETQLYDIVGPVCETGDTFAEGRELPEVCAGDLMVIHTAGAYGAVQSSQYNTRPQAPEILVSADKFGVVRKRLNVEEILNMESIPDWI